MSLNHTLIAQSFPALSMQDDGRRRIYLDNPAGTQVPEQVIAAVAGCLRDANANVGGPFVSSVAATGIVSAAHDAMADLLGAVTPEEIVFGPNMTTLTFQISRSLGRQLRPGDEIIVSEMDHDANVAPWLLLARDLELEVRWMSFDRETFEFGPDALQDVLSDRTRLVCIGMASNLLGTVNDVKTIAAQARAAGAMTFVDAVQGVPHLSTDVQALGCDFLACSAYKFFGPHQGILWGRRDLLESLDPYKVRPAPEKIPGCFETGTQSHEGMAGTTAAVDYFAWVGETMASEHHERYAHFDGRRRFVHAAMDYLFDYETTLARHLIEGLQSFPRVRVLGVTDPDRMDRRVPTVAFTVEGARPDVIAAELAARNIFVWSGHNYAVEAVRHLGIYETGGAVRIGPVHYNSPAEIDVLLQALADILPMAGAA